MSDISIIIVNYNVRYFLTQCIDSIIHSDLNGLKIEVIVVDNASTDDSFPYLEEKYGSSIKFIKNPSNMGFSKACNIGFKHASGKNILFLNPDTILHKDTLRKSHSRLKEEEGLAALGVKLIDGQGRFLPESKRSFPTPLNAFAKLAGIGKYLPASVIKPYNLYNLSEEDTHYVEVLCGAFLLIKSSVFRRINGFDESFFMYGEDIDLCKRIIKEGFKILYFPETSIIHYKGESQKVKSLGYFKNFYSAMSIYADKHFGLLTSVFLKLMIFIAGFTAWLLSIVKVVYKPVLDFLGLFALLCGLKWIWSIIYFQDPQYYPSAMYAMNSVYALIFIIWLWINKYYSKGTSFRNLLFGVLLGCGTIFIVYGLLPLDLRFSRMILILFSLMSLPALLFIRWLVQKLEGHEDLLFGRKQIKSLVVADVDGYKEVYDFLYQAQPLIDIIGRIRYLEEEVAESNKSIGHIKQLKDLINIYGPDELVFNLDCVSSDQLFSCLTNYGQQVDFKVYSKNLLGVIGSPDRFTSGEIYTMEVTFAIDKPSSKFLKWINDKVIALLILAVLPIMILFNKRLVSNAWRVFIGENGWVGYNLDDKKLHELPNIKTGIITLKSNIPGCSTSVHQVNLLYARKFSLLLDIDLIFQYLLGK